MDSLGLRLKRARERANKTQGEVCKLLGISIGTLSGYERNYRKPDAEMLAKLASLYGVSTDYILGRTDDSQNVSVSDHKSWLNTFSTRLHTFREQRGMTIEELAELVHVTAQYIHKLENQPSKFPGVSTLRRLAEALGVTAAYLVGDVADPNDRGPLDAWYQPKDLVKFLDEQEVMFEGKTLDEEDKQRIKDILAAVFMDAKQLNKRKK